MQCCRDTSETQQSLDDLRNEHPSSEFDRSHAYERAVVSSEWQTTVGAASRFSLLALVAVHVPLAASCFPLLALVAIHVPLAASCFSPIAAT